MNYCYCGRKKSYEDCCGLIHNNIELAATSEDLMRSRYSAFVLNNGDYLLQSQHSTTRPNDEIDEIVAWSKSVEWLGLEVIRTKKGKSDHEEGVVWFKAYFKEDGKRSMINERSRFVKENGHWVYLDGKG